jgi:TonB family protein
MEGNVLLQATVGPDGRVNEVAVVRSDNRVFDDAARRAVLEYQYKPGQRNGKPATFKVQITVSFRLQ